MASTTQIDKVATTAKICPYCGHHTLMAKGQLLVCRSCSQSVWRSES